MLAFFALVIIHGIFGQDSTSHNYWGCYEQTAEFVDDPSIDDSVNTLDECFQKCALEENSTCVGIIDVGCQDNPSKYGDCVCGAQVPYTKYWDYDCVSCGGAFGGEDCGTCNQAISKMGVYGECARLGGCNYFVNSYEYLTWQSSEDWCQSNFNANLASIHTQEEADLFHASCGAHEFCWTGLHSISNYVFEYSDGTELESSFFDAIPAVSMTGCGQFKGPEGFYRNDIWAISNCNAEWEESNAICKVCDGPRWGAYHRDRLFLSTTELQGSTSMSSFRSYIFDAGGVIYQWTKDLTADYLSNIDIFFTTSMDFQSQEWLAIIDWVSTSRGVLILADPELTSQGALLIAPLGIRSGNGTFSFDDTTLTVAPDTTHELTLNVPSVFLTDDLQNVSDFTILRNEAEVLYFREGLGDGDSSVDFIFVNDMVGVGRGAVLFVPSMEIWSDGKIDLNEQFVRNIVSWAHKHLLVPSPQPTPQTTSQPTTSPSPQQTLQPIPAPTSQPTLQPIPVPTLQPTLQPIPVPTLQPTLHPIPATTLQPTYQPIPVSSVSPTLQPTISPTLQPTMSPTLQPTGEPTFQPTLQPTLQPIPAPTFQPTFNPTLQPTLHPTGQPTFQPISPDEEEESTQEDGENESGVGAVIGDISGQLPVACSFDSQIVTLEFDETLQGSTNCDSISDGEGGENAEDNSMTTCSLNLDDETYGGNIELVMSAFESDSVKSCFPFTATDLESASSIVVIDLVDGNSGGNGSQVYTFTLPYNSTVDCEKEVDQSTALSCRWYDPEKQQWDRSGCELVDTDDVKATCRCEHLTAFAIIRDTALLTDQCKLTTVLGHNLWLVFAILYSILFLCALYRLVRLFKHEPKRTLTRPKVIVHVLLIVISLLNVIVASVLYVINAAQGRSFLQVLASIWAFLYILSYWTYAFVLSTWSKVVDRSPNVRLKRLLVSIGVVVSVIIFIMFVSSAAVDQGKLEQIVLIGSILVTALCITANVGFLVYGTRLIYKLHSAGKFMDDPNDKTNFANLARRIAVGLIIVCIAFLVQSTIMLISVVESEEFSQNFAFFQSLYMSFDWLLLFAILFLFFVITGNSSGRVYSTDQRTTYGGRSEDSVEMVPAQM